MREPDAPATESAGAAAIARARRLVHSDIPAEHATTIPVLGLPVRFASNSSELMRLVEQAFGAWRVLEQNADPIAGDVVNATFVVESGDEGGVSTPCIDYASPDRRRVIMTTPGSIGIADGARGEVVARVTTGLLRDAALFRYGVLEALTFALLCQFDRQPLHAAALARDDAAVLLAGPSGAGKSTLAYAGARFGLGLLAEDTVHVQSRPCLRVWGLPGFVHLPSEAHRHFPELHGLRATMRPNRDAKITLDTEALKLRPSLPFAHNAGLCILTRARGEPSLEPLDGETIERELMNCMEPGFDAYAETIHEPIRLMARHGAWRLSVNDTPAAALPLIIEMLDTIARRARED